MLGELLHLIRALEKRSASAAVTDSIAHRLANPVASSPIQSIQRGSIALTGTGTTATITSVNTAKAVCLFGGWSSAAISGSGAYADNPAYVELTNATTVTAKRDRDPATGYTVAWQVLEYK